MTTVRSLQLLAAGLASLSASLSGPVLGEGKAEPPVRWQTVVNQNDIMPDAPAGQTFNSFNPPSVNARGLVAFRARSRGGPAAGPPLRGLFVRDIGRGGGITTLADTDSLVPDPNNAGTEFNEFPAFPRTGIRSPYVVTRGNHAPVWVYADTRAGTSGIYAGLDADAAAPGLITGASKLGTVPGFEFFAVPGGGNPVAAEPVAFDVFPGAPTITDDGVIAFKGNYTDGVAKTGVFYRRLEGISEGGPAQVELIASSDTEIPNPGRCPPGTRFGSTAPPSAVTGSLVFVGLDNEDNPSCGGLYRASLANPATISTLVGLETIVPGTGGERFTRLGEALSYDGRFVGFWGAWGSETRTVRLDCPKEGNQQRIAYCRQAFGDGYEVEVPAHQGIFLLDSHSGNLSRVAVTGPAFDDFLYWNFSGQVPGSGGEDDGEFARWRVSTFVAVSGTGRAVRLAFKARSGSPNAGEDGLYLAREPGRLPLQTLLRTGTAAQLLDSEAPPGAEVTEVGIERDGFRGRWLAVTARMAVEDGEESEGMAGIYIARP